MTFINGPASRVHGTRACYTNGCRCSPCTAANLIKYHERQRAIDSAAEEVVPTGPGIPGTLLRKGRTYHILRCPGANGKSCVVRGGAWLKGGANICRRCVERATVWDGLVSADRARKHILSLGASGVGTRSIAAACCIGRTALRRIMMGKARIRASTEKQILSVDATALADGAVVDATETNQLIAALLARGFKKTELARVLGATTKIPSLQVGKTATVTLANAAKVKRVAKRFEAGEVVPKAWGSLADVRDLARRGIPVPALTCMPEKHLQFLRELGELAELRKQEPFTGRSNLEIINLSYFREHL